LVDFNIFQHVGFTPKYGLVRFSNGYRNIRFYKVYQLADINKYHYFIDPYSPLFQDFKLLLEQLGKPEQPVKTCPGNQ